MSSSMCIQERLPALCSSRFTNIGAKKGFLASKGLKNMIKTTNYISLNINAYVHGDCQRAWKIPLISDL